MSEKIPLYGESAILSDRESGYKGTAYALSELIDNSIEAGAKNIRIAFHGRPHGGNPINTITVLDDGEGMPPDVLRQCLRLGHGTRLTKRHGMGRFGMGLPKASISQCTRVTVFSWKNGDCYKTCLDVHEVAKSPEGAFLKEVTQCSLPEAELEIFDSEAVNKTHGTLVLWENCDKLDAKKEETIRKRLEASICRVYRHFLDDDEAYGRKVNIATIDSGTSYPAPFFANDPLFLLTPNTLPDNLRNEAIFHSYGDVLYVPIKSEFDGEMHNIEIRFSLAFKENRVKLGDSNSINNNIIGPNTGISLVRACREIDFGSFGFPIQIDRRERWWGCEIRFEPALDEIFGVHNNKQSARNFKFLQDYEYEVGEDISDDPVMEMRKQVSRIFESIHKTLFDSIVAMGKGNRSNGNDSKGEFASEKAATKVAKDKTALPYHKTQTKEKTEETKRTESEKFVKENHPELSEADQDKLAKRLQQYAGVKFDHASWPGEQFYTIKSVGTTFVIQLNESHKFFRAFYNLLDEEGKDADVATNFKLLFVAHAMFEDELSVHHRDMMERIRSAWGRILLRLFEQREGL